MSRLLYNCEVTYEVTLQLGNNNMCFTAHLELTEVKETSQWNLSQSGLKTRANESQLKQFYCYSYVSVFVVLSSMPVTDWRYGWLTQLLSKTGTQLW